jgi:hypothetical protein
MTVATIKDGRARIIIMRSETILQCGSSAFWPPEATLCGPGKIQVLRNVDSAVVSPKARRIAVKNS